MKKTSAKIILSLGLVAMLAGCSSSAPAASDSPAPANRLEEIKARGVLTVATEPYFVPNEFIDPTKTGAEQYVGSDMELAKLIAERMGVELEIVPLEFTQVLASVAEGKYDLAISALAYTPTRAEAMELSIGYNMRDDNPGYGLLIREENKDDITGPEDIKDFILITQSGSIQEELCNQQVPAYKEFKRVSSMTDAFLSVQEGKADAAAVAITNAQLYIDSNPGCGMMIVENFKFDFDNEKYGGTRIGAPKGETELIEAVNEVLREVNENGQYKAWYDEYAEYAKSLGIEN
ncbi:MAG: amino acid ABC transporter substrate-binding protein [Solobacterium sp.]|nr:amino acid ABC transporter substrate-binding protein [Solobacterium sp.]